MLNRFVIPAIATLLALGLLWVVLQVKPQVAARPPVTVAPPTDLSMHLDPQADGTLGPRSRIIDQTAVTSVSTVNERGTLIQFSYQTLQPLPQGVSEVTEPTARIHLRRDQRVIQIQSRSGRLVAPDRHPRSGTLQGEVTVCMFESPEGEALDYSFDGPHLRLRMDMEDAAFDLELGTIDSEGRVSVAGPRVEFKGTGLSLSYNELRKRIDRLEIDRGQMLRIRGESAQAKAKAAPAVKPATASSQPARERAAKTRRPGQAYRATFQKNVHIQTADVALDCDTLSAQFTLAQGGDDDAVLGGLSRATPRPTPTPTSTPTPTAALMPLSHQLAWLAPAMLGEGGATPASSLARLGDDELLITWAGRLVMEPLDTRPAELAADDDRTVELIGRPVSATMRQGEVLRGARMVYVSRDEQATVYGSEGWPLSLDSPRMGVMHGTKLLANLRESTATVYGPGHLRGYAVEGPAAQPQPAAGGLPRGTAIFWDDRLELAFAAASERDGQDDASNKGAQPDAVARGLRSADFIGDVQVTHPSFDLRGDQLTLGLAAVGERQAVRQIEVRGNVQAKAKSIDPREQLELESQTLTLEFDDDAAPGTPDHDGRTRPARLVCTDSVRATLQGQRMRAQMMEVTFEGSPLVAVPLRLPPELVGGVEPPSAWAMPQVPRMARSADDDQPGSAAGPVAIRRLVAQDQVEVEIVDEKSPPIRVVGERLVADPASGRVQIFGSADQRARVVRQDGELIGDHFVLQTQSKVMHVMGPGVFSVQLRPRDQAVAQAPAKPGDTGELTVQWQQQMSFDHVSGLAQFTGGVVAEATRKDSQSTLSADEVRLDMADLPDAASAEPVAATQPAPAEGGVLGSITGGGRRGARDLRTMQAVGNVVFQGEQLANPGDATPEHRLRLEGPMLTFDNVSEKLTVDGKGRMLFEDYRARRKEQAGGSDNPIMQMTGQGVTLFTWNNQLVMDAARNDMTLVGDVQLLHSPQNAQRKPVQLDCQRFLADLESTGGLHGWFNGGGTQPRLHAATADGSVRVRSDQHTVLTDHMIYSGAEDVVTLRAKDGGFTTVQEAGKPSSPSAREVRWDLKTGTITIEKPGAVVVPLQR